MTPTSPGRCRKRPTHPSGDAYPGSPPILLILEQQVSISSALATYNDWPRHGGRRDPDGAARIGRPGDGSVGFSRQKTRYARALGRAILEGRLDLRALGRAVPTKRPAPCWSTLPGIGPWTADTYLLSALRRPDVWPVGDRALQVAAAEVKKLPEVAGPAQLLALGGALATLTEPSPPASSGTTI